MKVHKGLFIILTCFFQLLSTTDGFSQTTCVPPVLLQEDSTAHNTIMEAYDYAILNGFTDITLKLAAGSLEEDLFFDADIAVLLEGGFDDCSFFTRSSLTSILGTIIISGGTLIPSDLEVSSAFIPVCAFDIDGDGHTSIGSCSGTADDCDDNDPNTFPGAPEICDGFDNNCDGQIDEGMSAVDTDGDGYSAIGSCGGTADDCNDNNANIHPGAFDTPGDGIDQDCSGQDLNFSGELAECSSCHPMWSPSIYGGHSNFPTPNTTCAGCHPVQVSNIIVGHYGRTVRTINDNNMAPGSVINCWSCHDYHDPYEYDIGGAEIVWPKVWTNTPLNCDTCHGTRAARHVTATAHNNRLIDIACGQCHTSDTTTLGSPSNGTLVSDADVDTLHRSDCSLCHNYIGTIIDAGTVRQAIQDGLNGIPVTCQDCHTDKGTGHGNVDHAALGYVILGATACINCHDPGGSANATVEITHNGHCIFCHSTVPDLQSDIPLGGGDCTVCHTGTWEATHSMNTPDHSSFVADLASCTTSCHETTGGNIQIAVDGTPGNEVHDACTSCHTSTGALDTSKNGTGIVLGTVAAGNCGQCHTANYFDSHTHSHAVSYNASVDTSQSTQQGCATCHDDNSYALASWTDIYVEHLSDCTICHSYEGSGSTPQLDVENAITSGSAATCATCHTDKVPSTDHGVDHVASGYVTIEAGCAVCHPDPAVTFTSGSNNKVHDGCTTCHDVTTNALIGSASGHQGGPNVCTTCHNGRIWTDHNIDHQASGYVTLHSQCTSCHATTMTAGQSFINPSDDEKHNACTSCHAADGAIATGPVDCSACHSGVTGDWTTHAQDHTAKVTSHTGCSSCHSATVDYAAFVNPANNLKHDDCYVCHSSATKLASASAGDCSQCHSGVTGDFATHTTQNHTGKVSLQAECSSCHIETVDYVNFVDAANAKKHDSCTTCHDATTNVPIATSGDCSQCHTANYFDSHTHIHTVALGAGDFSNGTSCGVCHVVADWAEIEGTEHNVATNGAGSCATCHNSPRQEVIDAINLGADPTNCLDCHSDKTAGHGSVDHVAAGYVTLRVTPCADCHDPSSTENATVEVTHSGNCTLCHTTVPNLKSGVPAGGGDCATCHGGDVQIVHPNCSTCHGEPPNGTSSPNTEGAHDAHAELGFGSVTPSCNACHEGATHYNGSTDVSILSSFDDKSYGSPSFNGTTCSNTRCHGGQTTPNWSTGAIDINTQCTSCHSLSSWNPEEYNSYYSGEHSKHVRNEGFACTECHSTSKLATGHFSNLQTTTFELAPGATIGGSDTTVGSRWDDSNNTCSSLDCHGKNHDSRDNW